MKTRLLKKKKKLVLNKTTISNLNQREMQTVPGGIATTTACGSTFEESCPSITPWLSVEICEW